MAFGNGNSILVSADPKNKRTEGIIHGTPLPGTIVEIETFNYQGGRHRWRVYQPGTDGKARQLAVLLEDYLQGKKPDVAYEDGTRCFIHYPLPGDEYNLLVKNIAGTADDHAKGERLMVDDGTGMLIPTTGTPEAVPFTLMEAITDPTVDTLAWVQCTGALV